MERSPKEKILFICTQNSGRSQMAEALLRMLYGDRYEVYSAGVDPTQLNPFAVRSMEQLGVDMSGHYSKSIREMQGIEFDQVVTVCDKARESCPAYQGRKVIHQSFRGAISNGSDDEIMADHNRLREEITTWLQEQFGNT